MKKSVFNSYVNKQNSLVRSFQKAAKVGIIVGNNSKIPANWLFNISHQVATGPTANSLSCVSLLEILKEQRQGIIKLATAYGADNVRIFGSVARGEEGPDRDVDFLVKLPTGYAMEVASRKTKFYTMQLCAICKLSLKLRKSYSKNP